MRDQATIDRLTANVANPFAGLIPGTGLNGSVVARSQLLRAFPQFTGGGASLGTGSNGVVAQQLNDGSSYFHAFQARVEKRFSYGFQLIGNFQWSRLIELRSRLNDADVNLEKRIATEDRPYRLVISGGYELPFGAGRAYLSHSSALVRQIVGGWIINGIYTAQPGAPLGFGNLIYLGGPLNLSPHNPDLAFDTTRFNRVSAQQLDYNLRTFPTRFADLRGDGVNQLDFSIIKGFALTEKVQLTYRAEFFNSNNREVFAPPQLSPTASNFGVITSQLNTPRRIQMALRLVF